MGMVDNVIGCGCSLAGVTAKLGFDSPIEKRLHITLLEAPKHVRAYTPSFKIAILIEKKREKKR